ncbi:E1 [Camelus dromedarius papillomavirus 1]|uniref:Replication protein E1 n=1 Tax=Camelus dromedarius papillomavirus 1 TaxID=996650 RepID=F2YGH1_9PAPI|nr:E1 [Camelus dromedarius papillomavirus 1]ADZ53051.1 E1 [Camelus dromedarius papillomavirus 1]
MADGEGTSVGGRDAYILLEASCSENESEPGSYISTGDADSEGEDLIDNASVRSDAQGNHLAIFQQLEKKAGEQQLLNLKRKLNVSGSSESPSAEDLGPTLGAGALRPVAKRRLFASLENTTDLSASSYEAKGVAPPLSAQVLSPTCSIGLGTSRVYSGSSGKENSRSSGEGGLHLDVLRSKNRESCKLACFKDAFVASFADLTRVFHSDKTTNAQWVTAAFDVDEKLYEAAILRLKKHCTYLQACRRCRKKGSVSVFLTEFTVAKCRETVLKLFADLLTLEVTKLISQPPKIKGLCAALFWFKNAMCSDTQTFGTVPKWISVQTSVTENSAEALKFDFGLMVQWAWDQNFSEESAIAYNYALQAETDRNAKAWLACSNQARYVKDAAAMVRHYKRAAMLSLSMSAYIKQRCDLITGAGTWLNVANVLKYHGIEPIVFVNALRNWLKGTPKKNCITIIGPSNTGKSMFCHSLISFLGGNVLSFANHLTHFWLAPLSETRAALIDDATHKCWRYFDTYLRSVLDGYHIQVDRKHRAPVQIKAPPLLVTSNVDVSTEPSLQYLHSRLVTFYFSQPFPVDENGDPLFKITHADWKCFFERLWGRLDLSDQEDEGDDGASRRTFTCNARGPNGAD